MGLTVQAGLDVASQELGLQASATTPGLVFCTLNALYQTTFWTINICFPDIHAISKFWSG